MVGYILKKSLSVLAKKPIMLWGVSLLYLVIALLISVTGSALPLIAVPITLTLSAGMSALFLDGYNGKPISSKQLFKGFSSDNFWRVTGGMCWYFLWSTLWSFVPVVGIIKSYSYRFTPYILITRPEVDATDALKISMMETKGYKLMMFLTDLLIAAAIIIATIILASLSAIPYVGAVFAIITVLFVIALIIFLPLFTGLVEAAFYQETKSGTFTAAAYKPASYNPTASAPTVAPISNEEDTTIEPKEGEWYCKECNTLNAAGTFYCRACGKKNEENEKPKETEETEETEDNEE